MHACSMETFAVFFVCLFLLVLHILRRLLLSSDVYISSLASSASSTATAYILSIQNMHMNEQHKQGFKTHVARLQLSIRALLGQRSRDPHAMRCSPRGSGSLELELGLGKHHICSGRGGRKANCHNHGPSIPPGETEADRQRPQPRPFKQTPALLYMGLQNKKAQGTLQFPPIGCYRNTACIALVGGIFGNRYFPGDSSTQLKFGLDIKSNMQWMKCQYRCLSQNNTPSICWSFMLFI